MLLRRLQHDEPDWSDADIAEDQPRLARLMWFHVDYINMATNVPDRHRHCFIVPLMEAFLEKHGASLGRWHQPRFRALYYTVQRVLRELRDHFFQTHVTCPTDEHDLSVMRGVVQGLWTQYQAPHSSDVALFTALSHQTSPDLALRVFEFVQ